MSDNPTPVEGKGNEMIPERGLPFAEEPSDETEVPTETLAEPESIDQILDQVTEDIAPETEAPSAETSAPPENGIPPVEEIPTLEEIPAAVAEPPVPPSPPEKYLDLDEIRAREQELAEDFHVPAPDFDGEVDEDFATARMPAPLPSSDREAIMLESGAGIIQEEDLTPASEPEPTAEVILAEETETIIEESPAPSPGVVKTEVVAQTVTTTQPDTGTSTSKETQIVRQETVFRDESIGLPGPTGESRPSQAPEVVRDLKASKKLLELLIPNTLVQDLWERADELQKEVFHGIDDLTIAQELLEQIRSAKNLILSDKANYEEAERALNEVEYRIIYGKRFKQWSYLGYLLLFYEIACGVGVGIGTFLLLRAGVNGLGLSVEGILTSGEVYIGILAALFGGLGGVAGALFALWRYMTEQKFNPQFSIWYITQPIIGLVTGILIYIILKIGFNITAGSSTAEVGSPFLPCLLAALIGFQQNVFLDLARQVFKQFKIGGNKSEGAG